VICKFNVGKGKAMKTLPMDVYHAPAQFADHERREKVRQEFWRTLNGPAQRPLGSNADEWQLFLSEHQDACPYLAVQIAEAIEEAELRGASQPLQSQSYAPRAS
jgi:hypothetical protein